MRVLSLFDGLSGGRLALHRAGVPVTQYIASEIDKYAIQVARANWSDIIHLGDVREVRKLVELGVFGKIDLLIGGSPCVDLSFAGKQRGLSTSDNVEITTLEQYKTLVAEGYEFAGQSYLFWEYIWIREMLQPTFWMLENVKMKKKWWDIFNKITGVDGILINSALVSAQNRQRIYWCNWPVSQPAERGIYLRDIIEDGVVDRDKSLCVTSRVAGATEKRYLEKSQHQMVQKLVNVNPSGNGMNGWVYGVDAKSPTLTTNKGEGNKIGDVTGGAIRGRNIVEGKRKDYLGAPTEQRLELRVDGKSNCITTVAKDSVLVSTGLIFEAGLEKGRRLEDGKNLSRNYGEGYRIYSPEGKAATLTSQPKGGEGGYTGLYGDSITYRKLTPVECERLQTVPDGYTASVSNTRRYQMLGNGWTIEVIAHIFREMPL